MPFPFAILLLALPVAELTGLIFVGHEIGPLPVLAWAILTAIAGVNLLRITGWVTARKIHAALRDGKMPVGEIFEGAALCFASVLLVIPGFLTDATGLAAADRAAAHRAGRRGCAARTATQAAKRRDDGVIEGEFTVADGSARRAGGPGRQSAAAARGRQAHLNDLPCAPKRAIALPPTLPNGEQALYE